MPMKKYKQKLQMDAKTLGSKLTIVSETSNEIVPKKQKPLTKQEIEKLRRMEKEMKEELATMKREAETRLAEFKAIEEAAELKAQEEEEQQTARVECLTKTCETYWTAKLRLIHENNKIREAEIWKRYITTNQMPYPESSPSMYTHLYVWQQYEVKENIEFALNRCDSYIETLDVLDDLIEYPLYSPKETVANWKELRTTWRREFLATIDKCSFHMMKNLLKNFEQGPEPHIHFFNFQTNHIGLHMSAWTENKNPVAPLRWTPKIVFEALKVEIVMPYEYRTKPFVLRVVHLDKDFFSDDSLTRNMPEGSPMASNLLKEINRCFEAKKEAKASVAEREREKVNATKQKVLEAQEAANQMEKAFRALKEQNKALVPKKTSGSVKSESDSVVSPAGVAEKRTKSRDKLGLKPIPSPAADAKSISSAKTRRGKHDVRDESSNARILMQNAGAMKSLDAISMRSGMRKRQDKSKSLGRGGSKSGSLDMFKVRSMTSLEVLRPKTETRKDSALCFEQTDQGSEISIEVKEVDSFDSLDLLLGKEDHTTETDIPTLRQLIKETVIVDREQTKQQLINSKMLSTSYVDGKRVKRKGKSIASLNKKFDEGDEIQPTASEIFENKEDTRQDQYLASLRFQDLPSRRFHLNLRTYSILGGTYLLELLRHVSQPHPLPDGATVQIFYGGMNVQRDGYEYKYSPPPVRPDTDSEDNPMDPGLKHLMHVKVPVPKNVAYFEPPIVALWDQEAGFWTNEHVHKFEVDMSSLTATFSLSKVMPFAFGVKKFSLLPYVTWDLKPKFGSGVILAIKSTFAAIEFQARDFEVCLAKAVGYNDVHIPEVEDIIGKYMHLHKLITAMKSRGVNVFPDEDACIYTENSAKDVVLEDHTNMSIAMWSDSLEFSGCDWNGDFKRRKLSFRVREAVGYNMELRYRTVVASSLGASIYRLGTEDLVFDETKIESYGFCPDVLDLLEKAFIHVSPSTPTNPRLVLTVYALLNRTKVHSYCGMSRKETPSSSSDGSKRSLRKRPKRQAKQKGAKKPTENTRPSRDTSGSVLSSDN